MGDSEKDTKLYERKARSFIDIMNKSKFIIFICSSVAIAAVLVVLSMHMYEISGAAQLDLSRPSYEDIRSEAKIKDVKGFNKSGEINEKNLKIFRGLYDEVLNDVSKEKDTFNPKDISDKTLDIKIY